MTSNSIKIKRLFKIDLHRIYSLHIVAHFRPLRGTINRDIVLWFNGTEEFNGPFLSLLLVVLSGLFRFTHQPDECGNCLLHCFFHSSSQRPWMKRKGLVHKNALPTPSILLFFIYHLHTYIAPGSSHDLDIIARVLYISYIPIYPIIYTLDIFEYRIRAKAMGPIEPQIFKYPSHPLYSLPLVSTPHLKSTINRAMKWTKPYKLAHI